MQAPNKNHTFDKLWDEKLFRAIENLKTEKRKYKKVFLAIIKLLFWFATIYYLLAGVLDSLILSLFLCAIPAYFIYKNFRFIAENQTLYPKLFKEQIYDVLLQKTEFSWIMDSFTIQNYNNNVPVAKEIQESNLYSSANTINIGTSLHSNYKDIHLSIKQVRMFSAVTIGKNPMTPIRTNRSTEEKHKEKDISGLFITTGNQYKGAPVVFNGYVVEIDTNKPFVGSTYVYTEHDKQYLPILSNDLRVSELEWLDFEKFLVVLTNNPIEAREIFTPDFMQVVYDWWITHKKNLRFVFKDKNIYIAIPSDLGFPIIFSDSLEKQKILLKEHFDLITFIETLTKIVIHHQKHKFR